MTTPKPTPTLFANLRDLLKLWQSIEAGKNPVWDCLRTVPEINARVSTDYIRLWLGNMENANAKIYAWLRTLRKYSLITTTVTDGARHEINHANGEILGDFIANVDGKYFMPEGTREQTLDTLIQQCQALAALSHERQGLVHARNFALWQTISQEPHLSGNAAKSVGCTLSQASTVLRLLERVGLAKSVSKGRFQIYSGLECRFLEDAGALVAAGIVNVKG